MLEELTEIKRILTSSSSSKTVKQRKKEGAGHTITSHCWPQTPNTPTAICCRMHVCRDLKDHQCHCEPRWLFFVIPAHTQVWLFCLHAPPFPPDGVCTSWHPQSLHMVMVAAGRDEDEPLEAGKHRDRSSHDLTVQGVEILLVTDWENEFLGAGWHGQIMLGWWELLKNEGNCNRRGERKVLEVEDIVKMLVLEKDFLWKLDFFILTM